MRIKKINKNSKKKLTAYCLAGTMGLTMLTGCGKEKNNILEKTILEGAVVVTFSDGSKEIAKTTSGSKSKDHTHYESIMSGLYFSDMSCTEEYIGSKFRKHTLSHFDIVSEESVTSYLTSDEIIKFRNDGLTDKDIDSIIARIYDSDEIKSTTTEVSEESIKETEVANNTAELIESETQTSTTTEIHNDNIQENKEDLFTTILSKYCGQYTFFKAEDLNDEYNKEIDILFDDIKTKGLDISEFDNELFRKYFMAPYVTYSGRKSADVYDDQYENKYLTLTLFGSNSKGEIIIRSRGKNLNGIELITIEERYQGQTFTVSSDIWFGKYNSDYVNQYESINFGLYGYKDPNTSSYIIANIEDSISLKYKNAISIREVAETKQQYKEVFDSMIYNINQFDDGTFDVSNYINENQNLFYNIFGESIYETIVEEDNQKNLTK